MTSKTYEAMHLKLQRHGERIRREYQPTPLTNGHGAWGSSTEWERPEGSATGILKRFSKSSRAHNNPLAYAWIKAVYRDAIEYTGIAKEVRGLGVFFGVFFCTLFGWLAFWLATHPIEGGYFEFMLVSAVSAFSLYILLKLLRMELFRPVDEPIIFDRRHRKVYRILQEAHPGVLGQFKPWPIHAVEYDWDLIDAEHNAEVVTTGGSVHQQHALVFLVRKSATDPTIIDSFNIGHAMVLGELTVPCVWEHIRRFMEENGPHLPPGESVNPPEVPASWWQATRAILPVGRGNFRKWLWDELPFAILLVVLSPLFVPMFLIWGTGNWLSHKTARPIAWPDEVAQAVGPALNSGAEHVHANGRRREP